MLGDQDCASVVFHGHVPRRVLLDALSTARVAVFPSYGETFGMAPVEAMHCGCPTVYTKLPPGPEVCRDGIDGLLVDPDEPEEIARAILRLLTDDRLANELSGAGERRVRNKFSLAAAISTNESFYRECIARHAQNRGRGRLHADRRLVRQEVPENVSQNAGVPAASRRVSSLEPKP
jgi:glycosyltransferase involved in cell wall biosynthesis